MAGDNPTQSAESVAAAAKRDRSPNYPAITYSEAEAFARKLWEADKRHQMTKDVAAVHLGYTKVSGSTIPLFAAMKRYGLLESVGTDLKITEDAHFIFVHPEDSQERAARRKKLAMMPTLFGEVLQRYPGGLPSDATLKAKLQTDLKFASPEAAETFIRALREAVVIAEGVVVDDALRAGEDNGESAKDRPVTAPQESPIPRVHTFTNETRQGSPAISLPPPLALSGFQLRPWELGGGVVVTISIPNPSSLTKKNIDRLKRYVTALENEAAIAWGDDENAP